MYDLEDMAGSSLTPAEMAEREYKLDKKARRAMDYIIQNVPIKDFATVITEELWLREILKDVESQVPSVRSRALTMLGQYLGILSDKKGKGNKKSIQIDESSD